ncbi:hypothetical protein KEM60_00427 [Austwickia sp. TVS 96-490-7B]|uniref:hypothetical protein n=1 Tax=Austwickia sp. TVS 96-490-7B TaxID=2830843 RepID=UPI001C584E3E|nr:hypothetical protein [Austwickia sp. TVS 96-490-7B]MBW3084241.1 hypothetical protein [Austwickia sp. TVS 96-490-7B]
MDLKDATSVMTAPLTVLGLAGGFLVASQTGIRPLGGAVLAAAGVYAGRTWWARGGATQTALLSSVYVAAFVGSHPLAKHIGAWPSVAVVSALTAGAAYVVSDRSR